MNAANVERSSATVHLSLTIGRFIAVFKRYRKVFASVFTSVNFDELILVKFLSF